MKVVRFRSARCNSGAWINREETGWGMIRNNEIRKYLSISSACRCGRQDN